MKIFIITDVSWDNEHIINKRFKKLSPDDVIHTIYSKNIKIINKYCSLNTLHLIRRSNNDIRVSICEILNFCDVCLMFHNFIQY